MASSAQSVDATATTRTDPVYGATIFVSAFLLFQVQLIMGKAILPWFGGTAAVWTTCMLVFQLLLLAGYGYAHFLTSRLTVPTQARVHAAVLTLAIVALLGGVLLWHSPILPSAAWKPQAEGSPVWEIIRMLLLTVAIPFFVLSTTGSLVQRWFAHASPDASPYRLYALSNTGSLLGLVCYPFVIEPMLTLRMQAWVWAAFFVVFALLCAVTARSTVSGHATVGAVPKPDAEEEEEPSKSRYALWLLLPACASAMLLATTNQICQEVAVVPFLWMLPLCVYLLSFILTFDSSKWYRRGFFHPLYFLSVIGAITGLVRRDFNLIHQIDLALIAMFAVCMVMHGELVRLRPRTKHLTAFYLMVATGGAVGGLFVSIVAPHVFPGFWEYQVSMVACGVLAYLVLLIDRNSWLRTSRAEVAPAILLVAGVVPWLGSKFIRKDFFGVLNGPVYYVILAILAIAAAALFVRGRKKQEGSPSKFGLVPVSAIVIVAGLAALFAWQIQYRRRGFLEQDRSFFGVLTVWQNDKALYLKHGETNHGWQLKDPEVRLVPTAYYIPDSGIGLLMTNYPRFASDGSSTASLRVGLVGLGVGTLASYGQPGDYFHFYEIDQNVAKMSFAAPERFTFVKSSKAKVDVTLGDGRLSLEREEPQKFDVLVLDAFSSDSVPVHLLTREAMQIYRRHLRGPHSVLAFHITNRALDLRPVLLGLAKDSDFYVIRAGVDHASLPTEWILMCPDAEFLLSISGVRETARKINLNAEPPLWTDDYSNLLQVLWRGPS